MKAPRIVEFGESPRTGTGYLVIGHFDMTSRIWLAPRPPIPGAFVVVIERVLAPSAVTTSILGEGQRWTADHAARVATWEASLVLGLHVPIAWFDRAEIGCEECAR